MEFARLERRIEELARIGAVGGGGITRLAFSKEDQEARKLFIQWAEEDGLEWRVDAAGNIIPAPCGLRSTPCEVADSLWQAQPPTDPLDVTALFPTSQRLPSSQWFPSELTTAVQPHLARAPVHSPF